MSMIPTAPDGPLLPFDRNCIQADLMERENRFVVTAFHDGRLIRAHCNNSGSMLGLIRPGTRVILSPASNPRRKLPYTLEAVSGNGHWIGVNTQAPNKLLEAAFHAGRLKGARHYEGFQREVKRNRSRFDALLTAKGRSRLWVECKNVTLVEEDIAYFPDAVTLRGQKHLEELMEVVAAGERAAMFYLVQRPDGRCLGPADFIDSRYAELFWQAADSGVEIWAYEGVVTPDGVDLGEPLPLAQR